MAAYRDIGTLVYADDITDFAGSYGTWTRDPAGTWHYRNDTDGTISGTGYYNWPDGQGLQWHADLLGPADSYHFTLQNGRGAVLSWTVSRPDPAALGLLIDWEWFFAPDGAAPLRGSGSLRTPAHFLRVLADGGQRRAQISVGGQSWVDLYVTSGFTTALDVAGIHGGYEYGWYLYVYEIANSDWYNISGVGAVAAPGSRLFMAQSDGTFATVGVDGKPLSIVLADGSLRTWPGSTAPLYVCLADGTFRQVIASS